MRISDWSSDVCSSDLGSPVPVLMVQDRGTRPYRRITVATDFSEASFQALLRAAAIFPESSLTLFHAYDIPFAGFVTDRDFSRELQAMETDVAARVLGDERIDRKSTRLNSSH